MLPEPTAPQWIDTDIAIVGGGMAGAMLAALLADSGLRVELLDSAAAPAMPEAEAGVRVSALTEASEQLLRRAGAWSLLPTERRQPYQRMEVRDGDGTGSVSFAASDAGASHLGTLVENAAVVAALYQRCRHSTDINWHSSVRVVEQRKDDAGWQLVVVDAVGQSVQWRCRLLVGADGGRSMVRSAAGIVSGGGDTGHVAMVASLRSELPHDACARQVFLDSGPLALLPLFGDGHDVSLVWSAWPQRTESLLALNETDFSAALSAASQQWLGTLTLASARQTFPIHDLHASDYVADGLALIGDAAHVVHPLAGQGINLGLLDAAVLAEEIQRALLQRRDWCSNALLQRYSHRRRGHNAAMVTAMRVFKQVFEQRAPWFRFLRNSGMTLLDQHPRIKAVLARQALGRYERVSG